MSITGRAKSFSAKRKSPPVKKRRFNKLLIPEGFVLKIDSREQDPLFVRDTIKYGLDFVIQKLDHGDYSYIGGENIITIERKYKGDFYQYIFDHGKTIEKLRAMNGLRFKALVIEGCNENDIYDVEDSYTEYMTQEMVRGFLRSINLKYNVHVYWNRDRENVERWVIDRLVGMWNIVKEEQKGIEEERQIEFGLGKRISEDAGMQKEMI